MDLQNSTDTNMDNHDFWMSVFNYPYKWDIYSDIQAGISMEGHSAKMDIRKQ